MAKSAARLSSHNEDDTFSSGANSNVVHSGADADSGLTLPASLAESAGFLLNRAGRIMRTKASEALQPFNLNLQEMGILRILEAHGCLSQQRLCQTHHIDRTTMVHLIDGLEERGLVFRGNNPSDRRSYQISLTPKGSKVLRQASRKVKKMQAEFLAPLSDEEWDTVKHALLKLIAYHKEDQL